MIQNLWKNIYAQSKDWKEIYWPFFGGSITKTSFYFSLFCILNFLEQIFKSENHLL